MAALAPEAAKEAPNAAAARSSTLRRSIVFPRLLALKRRHFLVALDQFGAFADVDAIEPEYLVVGAAFQRDRVTIGILAIRDSDRVEMHDRGFAVPGDRDLYPAAAATGVADEADHRLAVVADHVAAGTAAVEIAGLVAKLNADLVGIGGRFVRVVLGTDQQLHRADLLLRMLGEVARIVA